MRIVHIEDFFHPYAGYQVNILAKYMSRMGHEVYVLTSELEKIPQYLTAFFGKENIEEKDQEYYSETGVRIVRVPLRRYVSGRSVYSKEIFKAIEELKPDLLYVHGNDTLIGIQYTLRSGRLKYPLLMDSHMLEMASENRFSRVFRSVYKAFITPIIIKRKITVIRTANDDYVEKCLGIPLEQAPWISMGSDLILFHEDSLRKSAFREQNHIGGNTMVALYIGKLDEAKGGKLLAQAFEKKLTGKNGQELVLVIVGNTAGEYGKEVENLLSRSENRILRFPTQKYIDLPKYYQAGDFAVFPRQCSLSFFDAQACRLPVIAEDNSINKDRLSHDNGMTFEEGNVESLRLRITEMLDMDEEKLQEMRDNAYGFVENDFNYADIAGQYINVLEEVKRNYDSSLHAV